MKSEELGPSLIAAVAGAHDVRSRHGPRCALPALLTLATTAAHYMQKALCMRPLVYCVPAYAVAFFKRPCGVSAGALTPH